MSKKILLASFLIIIILSGVFGYSIYKKVYSENVIKEASLFIKSTDNITQLKKQLFPFLKDSESFVWLAKKKKYTKLKGGKYVIKKGMSNNDLVNLLRSGKQVPIKLRFNNQDSLEKLAGRIATQIEADSISLLKAMQDSTFLKKNHFTKKNALGMYIPNSYEFYWNSSAKTFRTKMARAYSHFWNKKRVEKAKKLNLTTKQVVTLASIVQKETSKVSERPMVAGLYLNRYRDNWPLQADPTVIFALKEKFGKDYVVKRVLNKDLKTPSLYNTYIHKGIPPALIAMPDISSIEAVLNSAKHNYYYMCASTTEIGSHKFAKTLAQHNRNAVEYQRWINALGIQR